MKIGLSDFLFQFFLFSLMQPENLLLDDKNNIKVHAKLYNKSEKIL